MFFSLYFSKVASQYKGSMKRVENIPRRFTNGGHSRSKFPAWPDPLPDPAGRWGEWIHHLRIEATSAVEWILDPMFYHEPRLTNDVNWMWIPDGEGEIRIGDEQKPIHVQPGDHVFLPAGTLHGEWFPLRRRWRMLSLHFMAALFGAVDFIAASGFPLLIRGESKQGRLAQIAAQLCREFNLRATGWSIAFHAGIEEALMYVLRHYGRQFRPLLHSDQQAARFRLLPVFEVLDLRLGDPTLTIQQLARILNISSVHLRTLFRQATGMKPIQFITYRRMEKARRMLAQSDRSAKEIAALCGFKDPAFFHRVFRAAAGETPAAFRNRITAGPDGQETSG